MPALTTIHIDRALTDVSVAYMNETLIADLVAPPLPVAVRSDKYFVYGTADFLSSSGTDENGLPRSVRKPKAEATEVDWSVSTDAYVCQELALRELVTDAEIALANSPLQPDIDATYNVTERIKLDNEYMVANLVGKRANYPTAGKVQLTAGATGSSWASYNSANSHPFTDIKNGKIYVRKGIYREANHIMLTLDTCLALADHPDYKDLYKYTNPEGLSDTGLVPNLRGLNVLEGFQQGVNSREGAATTTTSNIWVDDQGQAEALVFYRSTTVGPRTVHFARTFEAPDDTTHVRGFQVRRYRWESRKGQYIEASTMRAWKIVSVQSPGATPVQATGGYLISGAAL